MLASHLSIREIDGICREFETHWQAERRLDELRGFAAQRVVLQSDSFHDLLLELSLLDIEKRWKSRSDRLNAQLERSPSNQTSDLTFPSEFRAYLELFDPERIDADLQRTLAQAELNARWAFGDIPEWEDVQGDGLRLRQPEVTVPAIKLVARGKVLAQLDLTGPVVVGRQAVGEPSSPTVLPGKPKKLICSELTDTTTSRNQLLVEAVAKAVVRLENGSRKVNLCISGNQNLAPGENRLFKIQRSLDIRLKDSLIVIDQG
jgi:hypothetical protein